MLGWYSIYIFQNIAIIKWRLTNKWKCYLLKLKITNFQNFKWLPHFFIYSRYLNASKSICLFSFLYYSFIETICKMKLNTLFTKYMDTLTFNFARAINPKYNIMSVLKFEIYILISEERIFCRSGSIIKQSNQYKSLFIIIKMKTH